MRTHEHEHTLESRRSSQIQKVSIDRRNNSLILFCHGSKLNNRNDTPTGVASCIAWQHGIEIRHSTKRLGPNASTMDAAYEAILLVANDIRNHIPIDQGRRLVEIRLTNAIVARDCLKACSRDHQEQAESLSLPSTPF